MNVGKRIDPDFPEEFVSIMIQIYLTIIRFPRAPFTLLPFSRKEERYLGADAKILSVRPLYLQFKRSFAYPNDSSAGFLKERQKLGLSNPERVLYFDLRDKKEKHRKYQHNALFELRQRLLRRKLGEALYVAPLFLSRSSYITHIHLSALFDFPFFMWRETFFRNEIRDVVSSTGSIKFQNIPSLKEHISIPPHVEVNTHKHRYSFTESRSDVCFHSPEIVFSKALSLGESLYQFMNFQDGVPNGEKLIFADSLDFLNELRGSVGFPERAFEYSAQA